MTGELVSAVNQMQLVNKLTPSYLQTFSAQITGAALIIADCNLPQEAINWLAGLPYRPALFFDGVSMEKINRLRPCLDQIDGLKCNRLEAAALLDCSVQTAPDQLVTELLKHGIDTVLLSLGADGVQVGRAGQQTHFPLPESPQNIASVAGAGDALLAGFLTVSNTGPVFQQPCKSWPACRSVEFNLHRCCPSRYRQPVRRPKRNSLELMVPSLPLKYSLEVSNALTAGQPVVALESTIIAHGLPYPENIETAQLLEQTIRSKGAVPATIAVIEGMATVGLSAEELARIADPKTDILKLSRRDLPFAFSQNRTGATTVATTMLIAATARNSCFCDRRHWRRASWRRDKF